MEEIGSRAHRVVCSTDVHIAVGVGVLQAGPGLHLDRIKKRLQRWYREVPLHRSKISPRAQIRCDQRSIDKIQCVIRRIRVASMDYRPDFDGVYTPDLRSADR